MRSTGLWLQTRQAAHITERIDAAGHESDTGAYLAEYLGAKRISVAEPSSSRGGAQDSLE